VSAAFLLPELVIPDAPPDADVPVAILSPSFMTIMMHSSFDNQIKIFEIFKLIVIFDEAQFEFSSQFSLINESLLVSFELDLRN
jgi:hypothetical protein